MIARFRPPHRLVLILDDELTRIRVTADVLRATVPDARILVLEAGDGTAARAIPGKGNVPKPDVILVRADPAGWAAASVLAAHRAQRSGCPVDAVLVAEGPLEAFPVLITDFPCLRLLTPGADVAEAVAGLVRRNLEDAG